VSAPPPGGAVGVHYGSRELRCDGGLFAAGGRDCDHGGEDGDCGGDFPLHCGKERRGGGGGRL
jgi:hypothetical protein